jgi:hypothetical protein
VNSSNFFGEIYRPVVLWVKELHRCGVLANIDFGLEKYVEFGCGLCLAESVCLRGLAFSEVDRHAKRLVNTPTLRQGKQSLYAKNE